MRLDWLADVLRDAGCVVYEMPGWLDRGRDLAWVDGIVWHHTASSRTASDAAVDRILRDGRRDLPGPLAQFGLRRDGTWVVVAAGRANHNGYGHWGNNSIGIEAYNDGVGEPWPTVQIDAWVAGTAAICRHLGLDAGQVLGHKETDPRRKIDPAGIDMDDMRYRIDTAIIDTAIRLIPNPTDPPDPTDPTDPPDPPDLEDDMPYLLIAKVSAPGNDTAWFVDGDVAVRYENLGQIAHLLEHNPWVRKWTVDELTARRLLSAKTRVTT